MAALTGVRPGALTLDARFPAAPSLADAVAASLAALAATPLPPIARWSAPIGGRWRKGAPEVTADAESFVVELADTSPASVYHRWGEDEWSFTLHAVLPDADDALPRVAAACADAARSLMDAGAGRISLGWQGSGALCIPEVPVAGLRTQLVSATEDEVRAAYDAPERFWKSGWAKETRGAGVLLTRAMDARDSADFLRAILPQQWELARAARPGRTVYGAPYVEAGEDEVFRSGAAVLDLVGYDAAAAEAEYSHAQRGGKAHVPGWQVFEILDLIHAGTLEDGRPVRGVRVVFLHSDAAHAEKRPLLDIGARVLAYDEAGMLVEIKE
jgi:hypothetical protein